MGRPKEERKYQMGICPECETKFRKTRPNKRFCSQNCQLKNWNKHHERVWKVKDPIIQ